LLVVATLKLKMVIGIFLEYIFEALANAEPDIVVKLIRRDLKEVWPSILLVTILTVFNVLIIVIRLQKVLIGLFLPLTLHHVNKILFLISGLMTRTRIF
jgi:hypothetical protein